jgi:hypothetical protein
VYLYTTQVGNPPKRVLLSHKPAQANFPNNYRQTNPSHGWEASLYGLVLFQSQGGVPIKCMLPPNYEINMYSKTINTLKAHSQVVRK